MGMKRRIGYLGFGGLALGGIAGAAVLFPAAFAAGGSVASAASSGHYYLEAGGTGNSEPAPACTSSYVDANQHLDGGTGVPVCYPASAGPLVGGSGNTLGIGSPTYDASVKAGVAAMLRTAERIHRAHPGARLTLTGYSQGADVVTGVLADIVGGRTDIPRSEVDGMLYGDPRQPGTGVESVIPAGVSALGFTSSGPGPVNFPGIPVRRFCIRTDGVCDFASPLAAVGYPTQHPRYPQPGGIISSTLARDGGNGITWYAPSTGS